MEEGIYRIGNGSFVVLCKLGEAAIIVQVKKIKENYLLNVCPNTIQCVSTKPIEDLDFEFLKKVSGLDKLIFNAS